VKALREWDVAQLSKRGKEFRAMDRRSLCYSKKRESRSRRVQRWSDGDSTHRRKDEWTDIDPIDVAKCLTLQTVVSAPCALFRYHRDQGTLSNSIQALSTVASLIDRERRL